MHFHDIKPEKEKILKYKPEATNEWITHSGKFTTTDKVKVYFCLP